MEAADPLSLALSLAQPANPLPVPAMATATTEQQLSITQGPNPNPDPLTVPAMANPFPIPAMATPTALEPTTRHRFPSHPHPLDLIDLYLRPRVVSDVRADFILELDPYGATPEQLSTAHPPAMAGDGPAWYYFTTLRAKKNGGRTDRSVVAGSGWSWHQDRRPRPIISGETRIGYQLTLSYSRLKEGSGRSRERSGWMMSEHGLDPPTPGQPVVVLCKIYHLRDRDKDKDKHSGMGASTSTSPPDPAPYHHTTATAPRFSTSPTPPREFCHPPDGDLLVNFLLPVLSCNVMVHHNADIYKLPPSDLVKNFKPTISSDGNEIWYFFACASVDLDARMVAGGLGCWESVHATADVFDGNKDKLGQRKLFRFRRSDGLDCVYDGWHMVELTCNKGEAGTAGIVLCKVYHIQAGIKRTRVENPIHGCLGTKKVALGVTAGQALVM